MNITESLDFVDIHWYNLIQSGLVLVAQEFRPDRMTIRTTRTCKESADCTQFRHGQAVQGFAQDNDIRAKRQCQQQLVTRKVGTDLRLTQRQIPLRLNHQLTNLQVTKFKQHLSVQLGAAKLPVVVAVWCLYVMT